MWKKDSERSDKSADSISAKSSPLETMRKETAPVAPRPTESPPKSSSDMGKVSSNVIIKGEILGTADLSVSGTVKGSINIPKNVVVVNEGGNVEATIHATRVTINGFVKGNVIASDLVHIQSNGEVFGDIKAVNVVLDTGCNFNGSIEMVKKEPTPAAQPKPVASTAPKPAPQPTPRPDVGAKPSAAGPAQVRK